jgi:DNA-binding NtrC family response regulator
MKQRVLIVDDELPVRDLLQLYLTRAGYEVTTASDSKETLHRLIQTPVDLVVLDICLGAEDGLALLAELKSTWPHVRVVMLTGMGFVEGLLEEAHKKGADGYVSKVLPLDELLTSIQRSLKSDVKAATELHSDMPLSSSKATSAETSSKTEDAEVGWELYLEPAGASEEALQRLMTALSYLHIAEGGAGLKFYPVDGFLHVNQLVEV